MKHTVFVNGRQQSAENGALLSDVLAEAGFPRNLECGGNGGCGKCAVQIDGKSVLSCQYRVYSDISVRIPELTYATYAAVSRPQPAAAVADGDFFLADIGTTTLALRLVSRDGRVLGSSVSMNPQRSYGTDVVSRISYCSSHGNGECRSALISELKRMISEMALPAPRRLFAAGNTAMLHIFLGYDVSGLGIFPYTAFSLEGRRIEMPEFSELMITDVTTLPCISAFVGADALCGLMAAGMPGEGRWNLLCDLGTNAEVLLYSSAGIYATSAAAGPCFEGAGISCGMPALPGAVCGFAFGGERSTAGTPFYKGDKGSGRHYDTETYVNSSRRLLTTVGGAAPAGICGTGLFDLAASLLDSGLACPDGRMPGGDFELCASPKLLFTQKDMHNFQLAKAAVASAIEMLVKKAGIKYSGIDTLYISGGFSSKLNLKSASRCGLFPPELCGRAVAIKNSCLDGLQRYVSAPAAASDILRLLPTAVSLDLSLEPGFESSFLSHINF